MHRARSLLLLGIWVAILPYLGFPYFWKNVLFTLSGIGLAIFASVLYKEHKARNVVEKKIFDTFSENTDFEPNENTENTIIEEENN